MGGDRSGGVSLRIGIRVLMKEAEWEGALYESKNRLSSDTESLGVLDLTLPATRTVRRISVIKPLSL